MKRLIRHLCLYAAVGSAFCAGLSRAADSSTDADRAKAKLSEVRGRITALTNRLTGELKERDARSSRLREIELTITAKRLGLERLRGEEVAVERRRDELHAEEARVQSTLDGERNALAAQVRIAYMIGRQERIKLLLNQSDPAGAGRMAALYGYFARDRARRIGAIQVRAARVRELAAGMERATANLQALQSEAKRELDDLQHARQDRAAALTAVMQQVSSGSEELARLKREEQAEEALVADIASVLRDFPVDARENFANLRGRLPWPVPGRMAALHQDPRAGAAAGLRRNGILIEAARGAKVRAPYFGRVVYADWLQGLGLLLIIGHNGNYLTLYGHAEVLYKSVGDWVAPGDVIAALGDAGGSPPQLYFEIREGRTPKDPKLWLQAVHHR